MTGKWWTLGAVGVAMGLAASPAQALDDGKPWVAGDGWSGAGLQTGGLQRGRLWTELGVWGDDGELVLAPAFGIGIRPIQALEIAFTVPMAYVDGSDFALGNLGLGVAGIYEEKPFKVRAGLDVVIPTADDESMNAAWSLGSVAATLGGQRLAYYTPSYLTVRAPLRLEFKAVGPLFVTGDASANAIFPVGDAASFANAQASFELSPGVALQPLELLVVGARLNLNWLPTEEGFDGSSDHGQVQAEPYVVVHLGEAFLGGRLLVSLDEPFGGDPFLWQSLFTVGGRF